MTAQFSDSVTFEGEDYALAGTNGKGLFDPNNHGMKPVGRCSACWRGFLCSYRVDGRCLLPAQLAVCLDEPARALFGVMPRADEGEIHLFDVIYKGLGHRVPYSGGILLARNFIEELYVHMGFHPAWKYREVHELSFEDGRLVRAENRSDQM